MLENICFKSLLSNVKLHKYIQYIALKIKKINKKVKKDEKSTSTSKS